MRVERVVIRKLRALRDRDDLLTSEDGSSLGAVCLRGLNGSGKSTYLHALAQLWQWFHRCTQRGGYAKPEAKSLLLEAELVAALVDRQRDDYGAKARARALGGSGGFVVDPSAGT